MKTHELKTWPEFFGAVLARNKTFEVRKTDRDYRVGDDLHLREWDPRLAAYTGRELRRVITYRLDGGQFGIEAGHCILGLGEAIP